MSLTFNVIGWPTILMALIIFGFAPVPSCGWSF